jgi:hypothetical protein
MRRLGHTTRVRDHGRSHGIFILECGEGRRRFRDPSLNLGSVTLPASAVREEPCTARVVAPFKLWPPGEIRKQITDVA